MPNVLMITYYFPPLGSVQVLRAVKFAKYLPQFGWTPHVLSVKDILHYYKDPNIIHELPDCVQVYRTGSLDPFRIMAKLKGSSPNQAPSQQSSSSQKKFQNIRVKLNLLNRWFSLPDSRFGWYPFSVNQGRKLIREGKIDVIYSSSPPNITHLVALQLKKEFNLPWVADFRDLWFDYPHIHPTQWHRNKMLKWENQILKTADHIVTINQGITDDFFDRYPALPKKITTIVHGYDPDEYKTVTPQPTSKFTIVHTGSFFEPRQIPDYLFQALRQWMIEVPDLDKKIEVQMIGTMTERHKKLIQDLGISSLITLIPPVDRQTAIQYQISADVLLLLVGEGVRSDKVVPAKTWEYLNSTRTILWHGTERNHR